MNDDTPWTIRPYRAGDETALVALFARIFARPMTEAHWRWKLSRQISPVANVVLGTARDDGGADRPIFQYAGMPVRYLGPDGEVVGMVVVDVMTDPDFRRRGLLTKVSQDVYERWSRSGVSFAIGLPNNQWGSRAQALGWRELFPLTWRVLLLRPEATVKRRLGRLAGALAQPFGRAWTGYWRSRSSRDASVRVRRVSSADAFDALWRDLERRRGPRTTYSVIRDRAWIDWRYLSAPEQGYVVWLAERAGAPIGYCVSRLREVDGRRVGYLAELVAVGDDGAVHRTLLREAVATLHREGAELVASLAMPRTGLDEALRRAGFLFSWGSFSVQMVPLASKTVVSFSDVQGGDFDVV